MFLCYASSEHNEGQSGSITEGHLQATIHFSNSQLGKQICTLKGCCRLSAKKIKILQGNFLFCFFIFQIPRT